MQTLIVYSSLTGNTKKVAEAIYKVFGEKADLLPVEMAPAPTDYDFIIVGFWVDKGTADKKTQEYLKIIQDKPVALFATLGAYPDSEHAASSLKNAAAFLNSSNQLAGTFICQGKIDPKLIEQFRNMPGNHPHAATPERMERYKKAASHPDASDLNAAQAVFTDIKNNFDQIARQGKGKVTTS
ncbi:flavodoxin family protein [Pelosinus propionicus]|uniref:Flavodoxin domain-containing protein n=1 Tax=Pelosinus propionicus DSM 13327 TaxID=1123291 RepID=A0A1I4N9A7_9FIRM|nr:flavodoxin family protein [Pelosinus propionicus]SFM11897.1 Flavodoxin domain-containing protein [Pelosinus propionicus DSM 13327]